MRRTRQGMREHEEVSALGELKNLSRVPLGLPLGETETKHRGGVTLDPGHFVFWGMGSSGNLLGEQGKGTLPAKSLGTDREGGHMPSPLAFAERPLSAGQPCEGYKAPQNCAREHTHSCFFQQYLRVSPKKRGHHAKGLSTCLKLRFFFSSRPDCAQGNVLRHQGE